VTVVNARSVDEVLHALAELPDARLVAGGTDMMVEVNFGRHKPGDVVSLRQVRELRSWHRSDDGSVFIGSGLPYKAMEEGELAALLPALAQAARTVGSPQIRAAGTLGGNLGTCSPAGDGLPVLSALNAEVHLRSLAGDRRVPFSEFMTGVKKSVARPDELITGVTFPRTVGFQAYAKVGVRNAMVIAIASACFVRDETTNRVRLSLGAVAPTIVRCTEAETYLDEVLAKATQITSQELDRFKVLAASAARPITDHRSTAEYRRHAVSVLARRLAERAFDVV
jgi:CO/xanthine dehydrogenase FAD-binding subunit